MRRNNYKTVRTVLVCTLLICMLMFSLCLLAACGAKQGDGTQAVSSTQDDEHGTPVLEDCTLVHNDDSGGILFDIDVEKFHDLGISFGDSLDVVFSNGYTYKDLPYYNGYYSDLGDPLLVTYPGNPNPQLKINYGDDPWIQAGLSDDDTATIYIAEKGAYLDIQETMAIEYTNERSDYSSDEVFANFRSISCSGIRPDTIWRGASPCDNRFNRAAVTDKLIKKTGIKYIMDLADDSEEIEEFIKADDFDSPYFLSLYESGKVKLLDLDLNYMSEEYSEKLADGLAAMSEEDGPYYIHCLEGKGRTGFVCALIEALAGADYEEIVNDFMITYDNYYGITKDSDSKRYELIKTKKIDEMLSYIAGCDTDELPQADLSAGARKYLQDAGMSDAEINAFLDRISD